METTPSSVDFSMMMSLRITPPTTLVFLLLVYGLIAKEEWAVNYNHTSICTVKGSIVTMSCTYTYPSGHSVIKTFWTKQLPQDSLEPPDLLDDPDYSGRVQYLGDQQHDCTLRLSNVREQDQSKYYFRYITDQPKGMWQGVGGVVLLVADLQVEVPERVIDKDTVTLTCETTCSLTVRPPFTWYRNGHRVSSSTDQLHLQSVSREDASRYHCAVWGLISPEVTLNVRYGPKSVSVSTSPSINTAEGSSVTLSCSSEANPPVQNYTWFKEGGDSPVGSGKEYSFLVNSNSSGWYYCKAQNEHGSERSAAVLLSLKGFQSAVLYVFGVLIAGCGGLAVFLIRRKRRAHSAEEASSEQDVDPNAKDDTYTALEPRSRSSDVYNTLTTVCSKVSDGLYATLDPQSRSADYDTLETLRKQH